MATIILFKLMWHYITLCKFILPQPLYNATSIFIKIICIRICTYNITHNVHIYGASLVFFFKWCFYNLWMKSFLNPKGTKKINIYNIYKRYWTLLTYMEKKRRWFIANYFWPVHGILLYLIDELMFWQYWVLVQFLILDLTTALTNE